MSISIAPSDGRLPADPAEALERWPKCSPGRGHHAGEGDVEIVEGAGRYRPPRARSSHGVDYASHAAESGFELAGYPLIFTKLYGSLAGPYQIPISTEQVDWEVELVVVIGRRARHVRAADAWATSRGFTVGQDLSEREIQFRPANVPQFSLGKSLPRFGPIGPALNSRRVRGSNDVSWVLGQERRR